MSAHDADVDARWGNAAKLHEALAAASTIGWINCVAEDLRPSEGLVITDNIVHYKTARAPQLVAERDLIAMTRGAVAV